MSRVIENHVFPSAMEAKLRRIRWRQAGLASVRALALGAAVLIVTMLGAMVADWWFTLFHTGIRTALTIASLSLAIATFLIVGVRPVMSAFAWTRAANEADAQVPQLEERWTTISHFARSQHQPETAAAKAMLKQVTSEAVALGSLVEPARVVRVARLRQVLIAAGASVVLLIGFLAVNWPQNSVLLRRFWSPTALITATQLESITGDIAIPRGEAVNIVTRMAGLQRDEATLELVAASDASNSILLPSNEAARTTFTHRVNVDESFRYRVRAGDGQTAWHTITAIDPPEIAEVRLAVVAPAYVDRPPYEKSMLPGRIKAIQGSRLTLELRPAAELSRFELQLVLGDATSGESVELTQTLTPNADGWYRYETRLNEDLALSPALTSPYGLTNEERRTCRIQVIADKAPVARVISPTEEMTVSADDVLEIKFEAHDDHGIAKVELVVSEENKDGEQVVLAVQDIPLGDQQLTKHLLATTKLDLSKFDLEEGKNISYAVRVTDNRMLNLDPADVAERNRQGGATASNGTEDDATDNSTAARTKAGEMPGEDADKLADATPSDSPKSLRNDSSSNATASARDDSDPANKRTDREPAAKEDPGPEGLANEGFETKKADDDRPGPGQTASTEPPQGAQESAETSATSANKLDVTESDATPGGQPSGEQPSGQQRDPVAAVAASPKENVRIGGDEPNAPVAASNATPGVKIASKEKDEETDGATPSPVGTAIGSTDEENPSSKSADPAAVASAASDPPTPQEGGPAAVADRNGETPLPSTDGKPADESDAAPSRKNSAVASQGEPSEFSEKTRSPDVAGTVPQDDPSAADRTLANGPPNSESPANGTPQTANRGTPQSPTDSAPTSPTEANPQLAQTGGGVPGKSGEGPPQRDQEDRPLDPQADPETDVTRPPSGSIQLSNALRSSSANPSSPPALPRNVKLETQLGQNSLSNRLRLRIAEKLAVAANPGPSRQTDAINTRELLLKIDKELEPAETILLSLHEQPAANEVGQRSKDADAHLQKAELMIADLRNDSKETKYAFVGLQMLDIGRAHLTPARDRMFVLIQDPGATPGRSILEALHHTTSARELLAALTKRFEDVARERELADDLEEVAKSYEVYVENMQRVLREARQNKNPLKRKMEIVEVDEAYLERYAEVLEMRREIMAEFARILADDPRLMGKVMDLAKRRSNNLRDQLTDLHERQDQIAYELSGWLRVDEAQRPDVWIQIAEMRLLAVNEMVKDASQLESRTLTQLPLNLETNSGLSGTVVQRAKDVALNARQSSVKARQLMNDALDNDQAKSELVKIAGDLVYDLAELDSALEQLAFKHSDNADVAEFTTRRLAESRGVAEQALAWLEIVEHIRHDRFHGLVAIDEQKLAIDTDRLRLQMAAIETDLAGLFRPEDVPNEITNLVRELLMVVEEITFNQTAATYELNNVRIQEAEPQLTMALEGFERAEALFDKMRRSSTAILDEREPENPNIADLDDPTLDEFLARLEREPNLAQLLGIPNRPRNLRVIQDWLAFQSQGRGMEGGTEGGSGGSQADAGMQAAKNALKRAQMMAQRRMDKEQKERPAAKDDQLTEEEMKKFAKAEDMEGEMAKMLQALEEKIKDPATGGKQRQELQKKAAMLAQMLEESRGGSLDREKWEELVKTDEMRAMMEALAKGESIPDSQWNRLLSTLDTGLWQVLGRTPPEDYRKAIEQYQDQIRRLLNAESVNAN